MQVCDKASVLMKGGNRARLEELGKILEICESPAEQILLVELYNCWGGEAHSQLNRLQCHFGADYPAYDGIFTACCEPQRIVTTCSENQYRVDFYIYLTRFGTTGASPDNQFSPELVKLVVEVDEHDYHERTSEQVSRDRERDRNLLLSGYPVIRFSGSEVHNFPESCVTKINEYLNEFASELFDQYLQQGRLSELVCGKYAK